jgi:hypothetical protein
MGLAVVTLMLAKGHGANVNLERSLVAGFVVTVLLVALSSANPGLATVLALLVLSQVLLTYGATALKGVGTTTGTANVPQIASSGDLAAGAASVAGVYTAYRLGTAAVSGLAQAGGAAAGAAAPTHWSKFKNALTGGTEDAAELAAEGLA